MAAPPSDHGPSWSQPSDNHIAELPGSTLTRTALACWFHRRGTCGWDGGGTTFKQAIEDAIGKPPGYRLIKELVETMAAEGRPALDDLPHVVQRIVSRADQTHPADDEDQADS